MTKSAGLGRSSNGQPTAVRTSDTTGTPGAARQAVIQAAVGRGNFFHVSMPR
jgi:hypothetical protein